MRSILYIFRHPHAIYYSVEKLFHTVAGEIKKQAGNPFVVTELNLPFTSKIFRIRKNIAFVRQSQKELNHITGDIQYAILGCSRRNVNILTVHDLVLLHYYPRTNIRHWVIWWIWYYLPVKRADAITVISENTKTDLIKFTNCDVEKIHVIPNFIDPSFSPLDRNEDAPVRKILFIGTAPNKNLDKAIEALETLDVELIIVGFLNEKQKQNLKTRKINYRVIHGLTESQMRDVYGEADIMLFPSTYEGFGLPIIEAQATGRPVLTSRLEPMSDIAGGAACLVDPLDAESIRAGLVKIISDRNYRDELVRKGYENVKRFQLEKVTKQYFDLYQGLIQNKLN